MSERPFVLVVEDDPTNRALASRILTARGYPHAVAVDGEDALTQVAANRPDLILMDLSLPGIDGWEVTRRIRHDPALAGVRVLALTAHAMVGDRERALQSGCDGYVSKPYRPADLIAAIEQVCADPREAPVLGKSK
jgi:two-component system cell cycle response regulator DivK